VDTTALEAAGAYERAEEALQERQRAVKVSQVMTTNVHTLPSDATLSKAWQEMQDMAEEGAQHLVLLTPSGEVVGLLSDATVYRTVAERLAGRKAKSAASVLQELPLRSLTRTPERIAPDSGIRNAAALLLESASDALPVVDDASRLVGLLTRNDLLGALVTHAPLELWI
jgi:CBS domain-containing protein